MVPGVNLRSVGTIRDAQKWPKRDKRTDQQRLDMINYNLLSPYTIYKMMKAVGILKDLQELVGETSEVYYYQNTRIKGSSLRTALDLYGMAINKFLGKLLDQAPGRNGFLFYGRSLVTVETDFFSWSWGMAGSFRVDPSS